MKYVTYLVSIFHALRRIGTKFSLCEICEIIATAIKVPLITLKHQSLFSTIFFSMFSYLMIFLTIAQYAIDCHVSRMIDDDSSIVTPGKFLWALQVRISISPSSTGNLNIATLVYEKAK